MTTPTWPRHLAVALLIAMTMSPVALSARADGGGSDIAFFVNRHNNDVAIYYLFQKQVEGDLYAGHAPYDVIDYVDGRTLYVTDRADNAVAEIDLQARKIVRQIAVGVAPEWEAAAPNGQALYVGNTGSDSVSVISFAGETPAVVATIPLPGSPRGIAISIDLRTLYVALANRNELAVIDLSRNVVTRTVSVGKDPHGVIVTPDARFADVLDTGDNTLSVVDLSSMRVTATVPTGKQPMYGDYNAMDDQVFVADAGSGAVSVFDAAHHHQLVATLHPGGSPFSVAVTFDGLQAFVTDGDGSVSAYDARTFRRQYVVPLRAGLGGLASGAFGYDPFQYAGAKVATQPLGVAGGLGTSPPLLLLPVAVVLVVLAAVLAVVLLARRRRRHGS